MGGKGAREEREIPGVSVSGTLGPADLSVNVTPAMYRALNGEVREGRGFLVTPPCQVTGTSVPPREGWRNFRERRSLLKNA